MHEVAISSRMPIRTRTFTLLNHPLTHPSKALIQAYYSFIISIISACISSLIFFSAFSRVDKTQGWIYAYNVESLVLISVRQAVNSAYYNMNLCKNSYRTLIIPVAIGKGGKMDSSASLEVDIMPKVVVGMPSPSAVISSLSRWLHISKLSPMSRSFCKNWVSCILAYTNVSCSYWVL